MESLFSATTMSNNFLCLPEILRRKGYSTSWINGADAAYDNQLTMFPKIGFQKLLIALISHLIQKLWVGGILMRLFLKSGLKILDQEKEPFFSSALTTTNHHPFDVPENLNVMKTVLCKINIMRPSIMLIQCLINS